MNIDWTLQLPATVDIAHVGLAGLVLLLLIILVLKPKNTTPSEVSAEEAKGSSSPEPETESSAETSAEPEPSHLKESSPDAALQLLSLLQKEARLVDFVQEDLTGFSDADVGAAARVVHEGSKKTIEKYFTLAPVRAEEEETQLTIEAGFDPKQIRLTGHVSGEAPYKGILLHKGWKATAVNLPQLVEGHDTTVIAPAEVEL